jgi:hypothetical protein
MEVCHLLFVDEETNGSYPCANKLKALNRLSLLWLAMCLLCNFFQGAVKRIIYENILIHYLEAQDK